MERRHTRLTDPKDTGARMSFFLLPEVLTQNPYLNPHFFPTHIGGSSWPALLYKPHTLDLDPRLNAPKIWQCLALVFLLCTELEDSDAALDPEPNLVFGAWVLEPVFISTPLLCCSVKMPVQ